MPPGDQKPWTFVTNHTRVLIAIAQNAEIRVRDIATLTGITERSTQRIVADLEEAGYLTHEKVGRRNHYQVLPAAPLRHPREQDVEVGMLIDLLAGPSDGAVVDPADSGDPSST